MKNKGFTLIELLAVITIMGILMLVAIPAVSRTIENSRRDTFGDVALQYLTTVRNSMLADELSCYESTTGKVDSGDPMSYSATKDGVFVYYIATKADVSAAQGSKLSATDIVQNTTDLMESGGKSSWGNNDVYGYVVWKKYTQNSTVKADFYVYLEDKAHHGMTGLKAEKEVTRSNITSTTSTTTNTVQTFTKIDDSNKVKYVCKLA